jgi:hypothetical protein
MTRAKLSPLLEALQRVGRRSLGAHFVGEWAISTHLVCHGLSSLEGLLSPYHYLICRMPVVSGISMLLSLSIVTLGRPTGIVYLIHTLICLINTLNARVTVSRSLFPPSLSLLLSRFLPNSVISDGKGHVIRNIRPSHYRRSLTPPNFSIIRLPSLLLPSVIRSHCRQRINNPRGRTPSAHPSTKTCPPNAHQFVSELLTRNKDEDGLRRQEQPL